MMLWMIKLLRFVVLWGVAMGCLFQISMLLLLHSTKESVLNPEDAPPVYMRPEPHRRNISKSNVVALASRLHRREMFFEHRNHNISAAICYKTLFGDVQLDHVIKWSAYLRLLGFDHIFFWYLPEIVNYSSFDRLKALPFVTMIPNYDFTPEYIAEKSDPGFKYYSMAGHGNFFRKGTQMELELRCLQQNAANYTYVLFSDTDEYLWFRKRQGVKDFIAEHGFLSWMSFGKKMYSLKVIASTDTHRDSGFGVDRFAFTAGSYCERPSFSVWPRKSFCFLVSRLDERGYFSYLWRNILRVFDRCRLCYDSNDFRRGNPICPHHWGRSKILLKTQDYARTGGAEVHGRFYLPELTGDKKNFHTDEVHLKEWPWIFANRSQIQIRQHQDFVVRSNKEVHVHAIEDGHPMNPNGTWSMYYDSQLQEWFEYVASRGEE